MSDSTRVILTFVLISYIDDVCISNSNVVGLEDVVFQHRDSFLLLVAQFVLGREKDREAGKGEVSEDTSTNVVSVHVSVQFELGDGSVHFGR